MSVTTLIEVDYNPPDDVWYCPIYTYDFHMYHRKVTKDFWFAYQKLNRRYNEDDSLDREDIVYFLDRGMDLSQIIGWSKTGYIVDV